ncbi:M20/M25/M40 family metallo-hydrolase [Litoribacillus peritrichatus]|uniref:M20 family peptidase n=1 Tax=Litoribacillus peritrichatus TaxID=718191 RepID=A0ABP7MH44_9GAMM
MKWAGSNSKLNPVLFLAHTDVVPAQANNTQKWVYPPFSGTIAKGYIWGRGSLDNKVGVLGQLEAINQLLAQKFQPERTLYFAFGHDEESGGKLGAMAIANHFRKQNIRFEFLVDEGMMITKNLVPNIPHRVALIGPGEKGYLSLKLSVDSQGGHSSKPPMLTASGRIARAVDKVQSEPFKINLKYSAEFIRHLGDDAPMLQRMVMANPWLFQPVASSLVPQVPELLATLRTTTAPTILKGSTKDNVLATEASAVINFRILPSDSIDFVINETRRKINDPEVTIQVYGTPSEPSKISSTQASGFQIIRQSILEVINEEPITIAPMLVIAATDARHYQNLTEQSYRFSPYTITPETKDGFHGINERISVESYIEAVHIYQQLIINSSLPF